MKDDDFKEALSIVGDPYVLVSMIAARAKMLRRGNRPFVGSPETPALEDVALREIIDGRITYVLGDLVVLDDIVGLGELITSKRTGGASTSPFVNVLSDAAVPS